MVQCTHAQRSYARVVAVSVFAQRTDNRERILRAGTLALCLVSALVLEPARTGSHRDSAAAATTAASWTGITANSYTASTAASFHESRPIQRRIVGVAFLWTICQRQCDVQTNNQCDLDVSISSWSLATKYSRPRCADLGTSIGQQLVVHIYVG